MWIDFVAVAFFKCFLLIDDFSYSSSPPCGFFNRLVDISHKGLCAWLFGGTNTQPLIWEKSWVLFRILVD
jgi:hypothetical protein